MIFYLDTSAIVPMVVNEPSSAVCRALREQADLLVSNHLTYVEGAAALAAARRVGRLTSDAYTISLTGLDHVWSELGVLPIDDELVASAAGLAASHALRGYDAVHCASALRMTDPRLVAVTGDQRLLAAWADLGVQTVDING